MATKAELQELLDSNTEEDNEIDAVFVFDLENKAILYHNKVSTSRGKRILDNIESLNGSIGKLKGINNTLNSAGTDTQLEEFEFGTFKFSNGLLNLYFVDGLRAPIAVGFISGTPEGLGEFLWNSRKHYETLKPMLDKLLAK